MRGAALGLAAVIALAACQGAGSASSGTRQNPVAACLKAGQSCEVVPGKIGLCTQKDDACDAGPACLTCTSLH